MYESTIDLSQSRFLLDQSKQNSQIRTHQFFTGTTDQTETDEYSLYHTHGQGNTPPILVDLRLNGKDIPMELDTRATLSLVSKKLTILCFPAPQLKASTSKVKTYMGEVLDILGMITVTVSYKDQVADLNLLVVAGDGPNLMGCNWLNHIYQTGLAQIESCLRCISLPADYEQTRSDFQG